MKGSLFFLLVFTTFWGFSQQQNLSIDSLLKKAEFFQQKNLDSTLYYSKKGKNLALNQKNASLIAKSNNIYASALINRNNTNEALNALEYNLTHQKNLDDLSNGNTFYNLGSVYYIQEAFDKALEYYLQSIHFFELAKDNKGLARANLQTGVIYDKLDKLDVADYFYSASLKYGKNNASLHDLNQLESYMSSEEKIKISKKIISETDIEQNKPLASVLYYNLGVAQFEGNKYVDAVQNFEKSLFLKKEVGYSSLLDKNYIYLGECLLKIQRPKKAIPYLLTAEKITKERQQKLKTQQLLLEAYSEIGDYKNALAHSLSYNSLKDSISTIRENDRIAEITSKYQVEKQANNILRLEKDNQEAALQLAQQKRKQWQWFTLSILFLISSLFLGRALVAYIRKVKRIELEKATIEKKFETKFLALNNKSKVYLSELDFIKCDGNYLEFYLGDKKVIDRNKLKEIAAELPPNFVQTHRSYIVNKNIIQSRNASSVILKNGTEIPISRTFKHILS